MFPAALKPYSSRTTGDLAQRTEREYLVTTRLIFVVIHHVIPSGKHLIENDYIFSIKNPSTLLMQ